MTEKLKEAIIFATEKHFGDYRKFTKVPYITHPMEALAITAEMTEDEDTLIAAVLHDTVEDTDATIEEIRDRFGDRVAFLVGCETEKKRKDLPAADTWELRKQETIEELSRVSDVEAKKIALGDKLSNVRAMTRDYRTVGDRLWARFNQHDPEKQGWYYRGMANAMKELKDYPAWQEYDRLVTELFGK